MAPPETIPQDLLSWADPQLKQRLLADPFAVLREQGINVPNNLPLKIVHEVVRIVFLLWVEGKLVPRDQFNIDPNDEGLLFGRGLWESTQTVGGVPWLWDLHLDRLRRTAALLEIDVPLERLPDSKQVSDYVRTLCGTDVLIRLNVTAGRPGKPGLIWMTASLQPAPETSLRLQSGPTPVHKGQPYLTGKTFQYGSRLRAGQQASRAGYDTALLIDPEGNLLEAAHANVFVRFPDGWATPSAEGGLMLPGTVRRLLLDHSPLPIRERTIPLSRLREADEVFLSNSNVGIIPVTQIDSQTFPIGKETQVLMRWLKTGSGVETRLGGRDEG